MNLFSIVECKVVQPAKYSIKEESFFTSALRVELNQFKFSFLNSEYWFLFSLRILTLSFELITPIAS